MPMMKPPSARRDGSLPAALRPLARLAGRAVLAAAAAALAAAPAAAWAQAAAGNSAAAMGPINCPPPNPQLRLMASDISDC
jgi:hypothetical protein